MSKNKPNSIKFNQEDKEKISTELKPRIPINLLDKIQQVEKDKIDLISYKQGYKEGYDEGHDRGYKEGYAEAEKKYKPKDFYDPLGEEEK